MKNVELVEKVACSGKFKVGDTVRIAKATHCREEEYIGLLGKVIRVHTQFVSPLKNFPYALRVEGTKEIPRGGDHIGWYDDVIEWFNEASLELVERVVYSDE